MDREALVTLQTQQVIAGEGQLWWQEWEEQLEKTLATEVLGDGESEKNNPGTAPYHFQFLEFLCGST